MLRVSYLSWRNLLVLIFSLTIKKRQTNNEKFYHFFFFIFFSFLSNGASFTVQQVETFGCSPFLWWFHSPRIGLNFFPPLLYCMCKELIKAPPHPYVQCSWKKVIIYSHLPLALLHPKFCLRVTQSVRLLTCVCVSVSGAGKFFFF